LRRAFTIIAGTLVFAGLVVLTAVAAMRIDHALTLRIAALKSGALGALERMTGRSITYGEISPSFFRSLNVRDLAIHDSRDPARTLLTIHEVRVSYSLISLLAGRDPLDSIREIRILNSRFNVDLEKDTDVVDLIRSLLQAGGGGGLRAKVTGADIAVSVISRGFHLDLRHTFFQVDAQPQAIAVSLRGDVSGGVPGGFRFDSSLKAQGSIDRSLTSSDVTVRLASFTSSLINTGVQTLQITWKGATVVARKIQDRSPAALEMRADLEKREVSLYFQTQDLRAERLFTFSRPLARYSNWLRVPISASGHFTWRARTGSLEYQADATAFLEDQLPVRDVTLTTSVRGSEKEAFFDPLSFSTPQGAAEFAGSIVFDTFFPSGVLSLADVSTGYGEKLSAKLSIDRLKDRLDVRGSQLAFGQLGFDEFQLTLTPLPGGAAYALRTSFAGSSVDDVLEARGEIHLGGMLGRRSEPAEPGTLAAQPEPPGPAISIAATLKNVPPAKLYHLLAGAGKLSSDQQDVYNLLVHYTISTEAVVSSDLTQLSLAAQAVTVTSNDDPETSFHFGLGLDKSHLSLTGFNGTWKGVNVQGGFEGDLAEGGQIGFATNLTLLGNSYLIHGRYSQSAGLEANGSFGLAISALPLRGGGTLLKLRGEKFPLPLETGAVPVSFDVSGIVTPEGEWSADFRSLTIYDVPIPQAPHSVVRLSGRLTPRLMDLTRLEVLQSAAALAGSARLEMVLPGDIFNPRFLSELSLKGNASLKSLDGQESYVLEGGYENELLALTVQVDGVPLQRLGVNGILGSLSARGALSGPPEALSADMTVSLKQGRLGTDPLALDGRLVLRPDGVELKGVSAAYLAHRLSGGEGSMDFVKGIFAFKCQLVTEVFADAIGLTLGLEGRYSSPGVSPLGARLFDLGLQGKLSLSAIKVAGTGLPSWAVAFRTASGRISFDGGPGNSIHGWMDPQLAFFAELQDPLPVTGSVRGKVNKDRIHAAFDVESLNLLVLNPILKSPPLDMGAGPNPVILFTAGVASGKLVVDGEVNDPDFTGQLDIVGGGIRTAYSPDEAGPIRTSLIFDGKGFHTPKSIAPAGSAFLSAAASFTIDHWIPLTWDISLATESQSAVRLKARFGRLNAQGLASGTLRVSGDDRKTNVGGSLSVSDCRITLGQFQETKFIPEESPTFVNVTLATGRRVEFHWPSEDVPVIRTTASPGGKLAITYRGDTGAYTVKGGAGVQGGEVYYFDRSFIMKKGAITFNEDQSTFDPWITAHAEVREWDPSTGTEVRIFLDADSPFSKFSPRFTSDPPRASADILAMIGAPLVNRAESQGIGMAAFVYSDILSQNWILRPFEQKVRQVLNLDMFSVRTQIIQNLVAQKVLGTIVNPLDNTSVSLGKYLGNDLFLEMLVRLQQPQIPVALVTPGGGLIAASTALRPDLELSLEWATPLFLLDWTFVPQHPETMFLSDNSLSFSWKISY
jgi:translocation and assembly module TamB